MNFCGDCGNKLNVGEKFCGKCGSKTSKESLPLENQIQATEKIIPKKEEPIEKAEKNIKPESKTIYSFPDDSLETVVSKILSGEDVEKQIGLYAMFRVTKPNYTNEINILLQLKNPVLWKAGDL